MLATKDLEATKTVEEVAAFKKEIANRSTELDVEFRGQTFDVDAQEEFASLKELKAQADMREAEFRVRREWIAEVAKDESRIERSGQDLSTRTRPPATSRLPEDLTDISEYRGRTSSQEGMVALMRDGARKVAEQAVYPHERATAERSVQHIHRLLTEVDDEQGTFARRILSTGSPIYLRAFAKVVAGRSLSGDEQRAIDVVGAGALTTGGYAVPFTLDPTVILTSDGTVNPLRQISRVESITAGNTWKGVTSAGITVSRGPAEDQPVDPTSPTFGQPEVTVQPVKVEIQFSIEADEDWPRLQAELARMLQDAKDEEEADSFTNGVGTTVYPAGVVSTLDPSSYVGTTGNGFDVSDIYRLIGELPDRYEPRASFLGHRGVAGAISQFSVGQVGEGSVWRRGLTVGQPPELLGYPYRNSSAMSNLITTNGEPILLFGDFNNFLIVDKLGLSIEIDPHVRNGDGKWIGKRALLVHYRNSSVILNHNAFRLLVVGVVTS